MRRYVVASDLKGGGLVGPRAPELRSQYVHRSVHSEIWRADRWRIPLDSPWPPDGLLFGHVNVPDQRRDTATTLHPCFQSPSSPRLCGLTFGIRRIRRDKSRCLCPVIHHCCRLCSRFCVGTLAPHIARDPCRGYPARRSPPPRTVGSCVVSSLRPRSLWGKGWRRATSTVPISNNAEKHGLFGPS